MDSVVKLSSSNSEFVDEISSNEETKHTEVFANEDDIFNAIFAICDEPSDVNGYVEGCFPANVRSNEVLGLEDDEDAIIVPAIIPEEMYYSKKRRKRQGNGRKDGYLNCCSTKWTYH